MDDQLRKVAITSRWSKPKKKKNQGVFRVGLVLLVPSCLGLVNAPEVSRMI